LGVRVDGLSCRCDAPDCLAGKRISSRFSVVIHILLEQVSVDGRSDAPGYLVEDVALVLVEVWPKKCHRPKTSLEGRRAS
jgi:hypothetical protein